MHHFFSLGLTLLTSVLSEDLPMLEVDLTRDGASDGSPQEVFDLWLHLQSLNFIPQLVALGVVLIVVEAIGLVQKIISRLY